MAVETVRIDLVINGARSPLTVPLRSTISGVIRAALRTYPASISGRAGWRDWEIRLGTGELLEPDRVVADYSTDVYWWMNLTAGVAA